MIRDGVSGLAASHQLRVHARHGSSPLRLADSLLQRRALLRRAKLPAEALGQPCMIWPCGGDGGNRPKIARVDVSGWRAQPYGVRRAVQL